MACEIQKTSQIINIFWWSYMVACLGYTLQTMMLRIASKQVYWERIFIRCTEKRTVATEQYYRHTSYRIVRCPLTHWASSEISYNMTRHSLVISIIQVLLSSTIVSYSRLLRSAVFHLTVLWAFCWRWLTRPSKNKARFIAQESKLKKLVWANVTLTQGSDIRISANSCITFYQWSEFQFYRKIQRVQTHCAYVVCASHKHFRSPDKKLNVELHWELN